MFEDILSGEVANFKTLEQKTYRIVCELGKEIMKMILEAEDNRLFKLTDRKIYNNRGFKTTTVKTIMGEVEFKRRHYKIYGEDGKETGEYQFLLDEEIEIFQTQLYSQNMVDKILSAMIDTAAYRKAAELINTTTNISISHETVRTVVINAGEKIYEKEKEQVELLKQDKLESDNKEISVLFEEADGYWLNLQGKDRQKRIEAKRKKCEKEGKEFKKPRRVKSEIKMHMMHEGWKSDDPRHPLVNKTYITGFIPIKQLKEIREAKIHQRYNKASIQQDIMNGDGASWINKLTNQEAIFQKDKLHIHQCITRNVPAEYRTEVLGLIKDKKYNEIWSYLEKVKSEIGGEEKAVKKLKEAQKYLSSGLPRYTELIEELPKLNEGLEYRTMGNAESNIFTVFTKLFSGRKSFSIKGATSLSKVAALKIEKQSTEITEEINRPIKIDNSVEEYIKEIERIVEKNKEIKTINRHEYEPKRAEMPTQYFLKDLIKIKSFNEMRYI